MRLHRVVRAILLLVSVAAAAAATAEAIGGGYTADPILPLWEKEAAYRALESINPPIPWRSLYPDDLCLSGPHGIVCDLFNDGNSTASTFHITELNFGYVSDVSSNPPCGPNPTLPPLLAFPRLRKLFFYRCFTAATAVPLPADIWSSPPSLEELVIIDNPSLTGRLTNQLAALSSLRRLIISGTGITGGIPAEIGQLRNLEQLLLSRNQLQGLVPPAIAGCIRLKIIDLSGNRLSGVIPTRIGGLVELVKLDLSSNRISGSIPADLAGLRRLELLDLSYNRLTGGLPAALSELSSLRELHLSGNVGLGGRIPEIWEKLTGVLGIGLSGVGLIGDIPASMGVYLENITYLALDNNALEGQLPVQLRRLERTAGEINLANNSLAGRVPFSAGYVGKLKLGGNPKLCLGEDFVGPTVKGDGLGSLPVCSKTEIPIPVMVSSVDHSLQSCLACLFWLVSLTVLALT